MINKPLAVAALGVLVGSTTGAALADTPGESGEWESRKSGSVAVSGGLYYPEDTNLQAVYGDSGLLMWDVTLGYRIIDLLKIDGGVFFLVNGGNPLGKFTDTTSAETSTLTLVGFNLGPVLRLDVFREQPVVPYAGAGVTWSLFREKESSDADVVVGDKGGWYYAAGLELLLDRFEPARAADLDISRGINDTYITFEYRHQILTEVGETSLLDFTADTVSLGLKFDF